LFTSIVFFFGLLVDLFVFISITYLVALVIVVVDLLLVVDDVRRANVFVLHFSFFEGRVELLLDLLGAHQQY
jgi:hypothetical protein